MSVRLYTDVHVPFAITAGLRIRGVDVQTAQADNALRLDETVEKNTVETAVLKSDVILVMLVERVHGHVSFQFSANEG